MKFGINTLVWCLPFSVDYLYLIEKVAGFGFDVIEITPMEEIKRIEPDAVREKLANEKLHIL